MEPVAVTYRRFAADFGVQVDEATARAGFARAFAAPRDGPRYTGDGRPFWRDVVAAATGSRDEGLFEALYAWYADPAAWRLDEHAVAVLRAARDRGWRTGVASNWDDRLGPLLDAFALPLDARTISGEVGVEKPDPAFFRLAAARLGTGTDTLHVGDDPVADTAAARAAGLRAATWGVDVRGPADL